MKSTVRFRKRSAPGWIVLLLDLAIVSLSLFLAFLLRFNFSIPHNEIDTFYYAFPVLLLLRALVFSMLSVHKSIIRYTSSKDTERVFLAVSFGTILISIINLVRYFFLDGAFVIPFSVVIIEYLATTFLMVSARVTVKLIYFEIKKTSGEIQNTIIYGAGDTGILLKRTLDRDFQKKHQIIAFIDPTLRNIGKKLEGVKIYQPDKLNLLIDEFNIDLLIFAQNIKDIDKKERIVEACLANDVKILNVPRVSDWINGELTINQIKNIKIEDLLGRPEIRLDEKTVSDAIYGKTILITGAAGSIGSEIVRQTAKFKPEKVILIDQAESPLYELEYEIFMDFKDLNYQVIIGDIRDQRRMAEIFKKFQPEIVYHAAAYKHVPLMELNPQEAIRTNVLGTKIIADLSIEYKVQRFVLVSTDKAVNPTNVMGASKRAAEKYVQAANQLNKTKMITTRFGNVLGSSGSVIPLFKRQIEDGGPVTVTHPNVTRFFMSIPEACQLVLQAGAMGMGGEIFLFDMGKSIKIIDLAKKMIQLSGLELGVDIEIKITGLRPGEKLYEELLADNENSIKTQHPHILAGKVVANDFTITQNEIQTLINSVNKVASTESIQILKSIVPEYKSQNSTFQALDN